MSYEGYHQSLCQNGHYNNWDRYVCERKECHECKAPMVWFNPVDETNCESYGYIQMEQLLLEDIKVEVCNLGHEHEVTPATYRIPSPEETKALRTYTTSDGQIKKIPIK